MNGKVNLLFTIVVALITVFMISCKENNPLESINKTKANVEQTEEDSALGKFPCNYRQFESWEEVESESWYEPVEGKKLGFNAANSFASIRQMKEKFGFSKVLVYNTEQRDSAIAAGFSWEDIVGAIDRKKIEQNDLSNSYIPGFKSYFLDEPFEDRDNHPKIPQSYVKRLAQNISPSKLLLSSYTQPKSYYHSILFHEVNTEIMCDNYYGDYIQWLYSNQDQRGNWDDYKTLYQSNNTSNWISLIIDAKPSQGDGTFKELLEWSKDNGFNEMWLWIGNAGDDHAGKGEVLTKAKFDKDIKRFKTLAMFAGWLKHKQVKKLYSYTYRCSRPCSLCDQEDIYAPGWRLTRKVYRGSKRVVTYQY